MGVFCADDTTNQRRQGTQLLFAMTVGLGWDDLSQGLFYGTLTAMGVTHGMCLPVLQWYETAGRAYQMGHPLRQRTSLNASQLSHKLSVR